MTKKRTLQEKKILVENIVINMFKLIFSGKSSKAKKIASKDPELVKKIEELEHMVNDVKIDFQNYFDKYGI